jgi:Fe-S-cluster containining protein
MRRVYVGAPAAIKMANMTEHPCIGCGACCAHYRVAFHWSETTSFDPAGMPVEHTIAIDPHRVAMRGTDGQWPHCTMLAGRVGVDARCLAYASRPSPCRDLGPAWEHGEASPQCDRARIAYGLAPLTPEFWLALRGDASDQTVADAV